MRYLMIVKATPTSERGEFPPDAERMFAEMAEFNNEMIAAGVMLDGAGLQPSSAGKRVRFEGRGKTLVTDGPFAETKELIAGFWIWKVKSMDEALEWVKRIPTGSEEMLIELRRVHEAEDFGEEFTPEARAQEERLRAEIASKS
jgi:hypothetical protein